MIEVLNNPYPDAVYQDGQVAVWRGESSSGFEADFAVIQAGTDFVMPETQGEQQLRLHETSLAQALKVTIVTDNNISFEDFETLEPYDQMTVRTGFRPRLVVPEDQPAANVICEYPGLIANSCKERFAAMHRDVLHRELHKLTDAEQELFVMHLGLLGQVPRSLTWLDRHFKVYSDYSRVVVTHALRKINAIDTVAENPS